MLQYFIAHGVNPPHMCYLNYVAYRIVRSSYAENLLQPIKMKHIKKTTRVPSKYVSLGPQLFPFGGVPNTKTPQSNLPS